MSGSSRIPAGVPTRRVASTTNGSMNPPGRPGTGLSSRSHKGIASSPMNPNRMRAGTASPLAAKRRGAEDTISPGDTLSESNINVVVRCRARSEREKSENSAIVVSHPSHNEVALSLGPVSNKLYTFDRSFGPEADQQRIFDNVVAPLLNEVLEGYNCTIFAYGQTGTGKTYTMTGDMTESFGTYTDYAGIIPRVLYKLFERLEKGESDNSVKCSFIELYNEDLRDLLAHDDSSKVKIFDATNGKGGVVVHGMEETYVSSASAGVKLLKEGSHKRQVAATKCNDLSSRSHTVFTITVNVKEFGHDDDVVLRTGKLNLVDLAGSESVGRSGAENKRAREAGMINQSLLTLGRVINALVDKSPHIPYRESKLTRLLQDSLGGHTKTTIIATISPAKTNLEETMSTLDYASRAKDILNKPQVNQPLNKRTMVSQFVTDIARLKAALHAARLKNGIYLPQEDFNQMTVEMETAKNELDEAKRNETLLTGLVERTRAKFETAMLDLLDTRKTLDEQKQFLDEMKKVLEETKINLTQTTEKLEEETIVRMAHQKTEGELYSTGRDLLSTARSATSDLEGLHAKIGRMANLEVANHSAWMRTTSKVSQATLQVENEIDVLAGEQQALAGAISKRITSFVTDEKAKLQEAHSFIEERLANFKGKEEELSRETYQSKNDMNEVLEEIKILKEDIKIRVGEGLKGLNNAADRMAHDVISDLGNFGAELHDSYHRLDQGFKGMVVEAQKHIIAQKTEIEKLRLQVASATAAASFATEAAQNTLNTILSEEREIASADRQNLISQISMLINNSAAEQDRRLTERVEAVRIELKGTQAHLDETSNAYDIGMDNWSSTEEKFYTRICDAKDTVRTVLAKDLENVKRHHAIIEETSKSINAHTIKIVEEQTEEVGVHMQALDEFVARARIHNEEHHDAFVQNLDTLTSNACESFIKWTADVQLFMGQINSITNIAAEASESAESIGPFTKAIREKLTQLRQHVEAGNLQEYVPTTQTPRKKKYEFPTSLPSTGTVDEVLARARGGGGGEETEEVGVTKRPPLGEKEVNSPKKPTPSVPSVLTDPKSGGAGIGSAFYPSFAVKKALFRDTSIGTENMVGSPKDGSDNSSSASNLHHGYVNQNSDEDFGSSTITTVAKKRRSLRKRKAEEDGGGGGVENGFAMASNSITTRRRVR